MGGLEVIHKLTMNIVNNTGEAKFKILKTNNKTIKAKVMCLNPVESVYKLLEFLGYV